MPVPVVGPAHSPESEVEVGFATLVEAVPEGAVVVDAGIVAECVEVILAMVVIVEEVPYRKSRIEVACTHRTYSH